MKNQEFHDYVVYDLFADIDGITSRRMFGGWGIYKNGVIFALITGGELYFKVGESNRNDFKKHKSKPFTFKKKTQNKQISLSY